MNCNAAKLRPDGRCFYPTRPPLKPSPLLLFKFKLISSSVSGLSTEGKFREKRLFWSPFRGPKRRPPLAPRPHHRSWGAGSPPPGKGSVEHCVESQAAACAPLCRTPKPTGAALSTRGLCSGISPRDSFLHNNHVPEKCKLISVNGILFQMCGEALYFKALLPHL